LLVDDIVIYLYNKITQHVVGRLIEQGKHELLLAQNGFYAELWKSQFEQAS
jgi:ABC-type multidrug transport system fused ATPase/permease subunit